MCGFKTLSSTSIYFKCLRTVTSVVSTPVPGNTGSHYHVHVLLLSRGSKSTTSTTLDSELLGNHLPLRWGMSSAHFLDWETSRNASAIATASLSLWSWIDSCLLGTETWQKHQHVPIGRNHQRMLKGNEKFSLSRKLVTRNSHFYDAWRKSNV